MFRSFEEIMRGGGERKVTTTSQNERKHSVTEGNKGFIGNFRVSFMCTNWESLLCFFCQRKITIQTDQTSTIIAQRRKNPRKEIQFLTTIMVRYGLPHPTSLEGQSISPLGVLEIEVNCALGAVLSLMGCVYYTFLLLTLTHVAIDTSCTDICRSATVE